MANDMICYICNDALSFRDYKGTKMVDEDGNIPCYDCLLEAGVFDEETQQ